MYHNGMYWKRCCLLYWEDYSLPEKIPLLAAFQSMVVNFVLRKPLNSSAALKTIFALAQAWCRSQFAES